MRFIFLFFFSFVVWSCQKKATKAEILVPSTLNGSELSKKYCGSCHLVPDPSMLPSDIWSAKVLPKMALRLGTGDLMGEMMALSEKEMIKLMESGIYPENPVMHETDWQKIKEYYISNAPKSLENLNTPKVAELENVKVKEFDFGKMIVQTEFEDGYIRLSTREPNESLLIDDQGKIFKKENAKFPVLDSESGYFLEVGKMDPNESAEGRLTLNGEVILSELKRPVSLEITDINEDGIKDFLIANFGNEAGNLSWYDGKTLKQNIVWSMPGCRKSYFLDYDGDGKRDIVAMFSQAKEEIIFFKNSGDGHFEPQTLLAFPAVYGSSYFELQDMNGDKKLDVVYTNGDNADLSIVLKPYHGVRVFMNENNGFKEKYFYPINGASKVMCADFDNDADLDMAVISFFPDNTKHEGFMYFENDGLFKFTPKTISKLAKTKWLTMDISLPSIKGKRNIVLGSFVNDFNYDGVSKKKSVAIIKFK